MLQTFPGPADTATMMFNMVSRYLLFTGLAYFFFYVWQRRRYWLSRIQQRYPDKKQVLNEIKNSFITMMIFGFIVTLTVWAGKSGLTAVYSPTDKYGYVYYVFSILLMIVVHDTYFYWTHRLLHWKPLFKTVHKTHHLSVNPTPFAAYAFHPVEAVVEVGIIPLVAFTVPHAASAITIFTLYSLFLNVIGHLGYELFPKGFASHWLFKWHNTSTHHNMHHRLVKYNFGLYFNFWDRIMGTNHPKYVESFDEVVARRTEEESQEPRAKNQEKHVLTLDS